MATWATKPLEVYLRELQAGRARTRRQAAAALQVLGDRRAVGPLIAALTDDDKDVRAIAARALGALDDRHAVPPLLHALHDAHPDVRCAAAQALWRLGDRMAIHGLADALHDPEPLVRYFAACALVYPYTPGGTNPPLIDPFGEHATLYHQAKQAMMTERPSPPS